jgi:hypothetical protein
MLLNIHNEESLRIRNKKFSSEWPFKERFDIEITDTLHFFAIM